MVLKRIYHLRKYLIATTTNEAKIKTSILVVAIYHLSTGFKLLGKLHNN